MKLLAAAIASLSWMVSACAQADKTAVTPRSNALPPVLTLDDVRMVAPALERYTQQTSPQHPGSSLLLVRRSESGKDRGIISDYVP
jgi:hypothetical protein